MTSIGNTFSYIALQNTIRLVYSRIQIGLIKGLIACLSYLHYGLLKNAMKVNSFTVFTGR